mgnify:CR=1 FL=1
MNNVNTVENVKKKMKFRNYVPRDKKLLYALKKERESGIPNVSIPENLPINDILKRELDELTSQKLDENNEMKLIMPKKPNWDLKNQVNERMEKLNRRTQRAIVDILRAKLIANEDEDEPSVDDMM